MEYYYDNEEVAQVLCESTYDDCNMWDSRYKEAVEALGWLKSAADNPLNSSCFRTFYQLLQDFTNINEGLLK